MEISFKIRIHVKIYSTLQILMVNYVSKAIYSIYLVFNCALGSNGITFSQRQIIFHQLDSEVRAPRRNCVLKSEL